MKHANEYCLMQTFNCTYKKLCYSIWFQRPIIITYFSGHEGAKIQSNTNPIFNTHQ